MSKLRIHNRFICVGVDVSIYALLTGGRSLYPAVLACTVPTFSVVIVVVVVCVCVWITLGTVMCCIGQE